MIVACIICIRQFNSSTDQTKRSESHDQAEIRLRQFKAALIHSQCAPPVCHHLFPGSKFSNWLRYRQSFRMRNQEYLTYRHYKNQVGNPTLYRGSQFSTFIDVSRDLRYRRMHFYGWLCISLPNFSVNFPMMMISFLITCALLKFSKNLIHSVVVLAEAIMADIPAQQNKQQYR